MNPGVSFIVRCRNEEEYLYNSLMSLSGLDIPHEIIVILHLCTDRSKEIAEKLQATGMPIKIVEYNEEVSRAGYETLVTPASSKHSIVQYLKYAYSLAQYNWIFKWDADFVATGPLLNFLEYDLILDEETPVRFRLGCELGTDALNAEFYLFNCLVDVQKYMFWEVPVFADGAINHDFSQLRIKSVSYKTLKEYWEARPWFKAHPSTVEELVLAVNYDYIVSLVGEEPLGLARASNPECDGKLSALLQVQEHLLEKGISFYS